MSGTFYIKRGDTSPALRFALEPAVGLVGASVQFQMRLRGGATIIDAPCNVLDASVVEYNWAASDTADDGVYEAEFRVTYADGAIETFPNNGFLTVRIAEDIR
ncbi:hypothetical protein L0V05_03465 [Tabrizicola sp. J26]|uniref:hypothetical protein n=1 Tax=Alitabrizicola rongguiensis TaxID=2909234 RepID=UPI001F1D222B|nr:hypothetical protein [Tabrizicola rongguiensis]MCF1707871.1 hypothetical protein [Tabrizicola rongguiensis]